MSSHSASQLFDVFVEAKSALEELPKLKQELADTSELAKSYADDLNMSRDANAQILSELKDVKAALADKEAVLARVTFQHETLRSAIGAINDTVRSVSDRPVSEPVAEPVPQPVSEASSEQGQSAADPIAKVAQHGETQSATHAESTSSASAGGNSNEEGTTQADRPLAPENASHSATTSDANMATTAPNGSPAGTDSPIPSPMEDRERLGELDTNHSHLGSAPSTTQTETSSSSNHAVAPTPTMNDKPYLGWGSHRKPHAVTWGDFERLGGYRPYWCNPDLT